MILAIVILGCGVVGEAMQHRVVVDFEESTDNIIGRISRTAGSGTSSIGIHNDAGALSTCMVGSAIPCWQLLLFIIVPVALLVLSGLIQLFYYTGCCGRQAKTFSPNNYPVISASVSQETGSEQTENTEEINEKRRALSMKPTEVICCGYWRRGVVSGIISFLSVVVVLYSAATPFATLKQEFAGDVFKNGAGDDVSIDVTVSREVGIFQSCSRIQNTAVVRSGQSSGEILDEDVNFYCRSTSDICEGFNTILLMARVFMASTALCLCGSLVFSFFNSVGKMPSWTASLHYIAANVQIVIVICLQFILNNNPFCNHDELIDPTDNSTLNGNFVRRSFSHMGYKTSSSIFLLMFVWLLTVYILIAISNHTYQLVYLHSEGQQGGNADDYYFSRFFAHKSKDDRKGCIRIEKGLLGFLVIPPAPHDRTPYLHFVSSLAFVANVQRRTKSKKKQQQPPLVQQQQPSQPSPAASDLNGNIFVVRNSNTANTNKRKNVPPLRGRVQQLLHKDELDFDSDDGHTNEKNQQGLYVKSVKSSNDTNPLRGPNFF